MPNFVDGLSELDGRVLALVEMRGVYRVAANPLQEVDVTDQFMANLRVHNAAEGILESSFRIDMHYNTNRPILDDRYWDVRRIYLATDWSWSPRPGMELPMQYHDYWIDDGWEVDEVGGQKVLFLN